MPSGPSPSSPPASAPARVSASPRPSPTVDPSAAAIRAFVALVTGDGFSYQATFTGHSRHTTDVLPISKGLLQVHGSDVRVLATFTFPDASIAVEHRWVGGKGWIRFGTGAWQGLRMTSEQTMAAFGAVRTPADVTFVRTTTSGGATRYEVRIKAAIVNPVMVPASNLTETVVTSSRLTLLIDAAGRPVSGTSEIDGHGRVSGQLQEVAIDLAVTFMKVGKAVSISAP